MSRASTLASGDAESELLSNREVADKVETCAATVEAGSAVAAAVNGATSVWDAVAVEGDAAVKLLDCDIADCETAVNVESVWDKVVDPANGKGDDSVSCKVVESVGDKLVDPASGKVDTETGGGVTAIVVDDDEVDFAVIAMVDIVFDVTDVRIVEVDVGGGAVHHTPDPLGKRASVDATVEVNPLYDKLMFVELRLVIVYVTVAGMKAVHVATYVFSNMMVLAFADRKLKSR